VAKAKGRVRVNKNRGFLYLLAKWLGDFQAAQIRRCAPGGVALSELTREKR